MHIARQISSPLHILHVYKDYPPVLGGIEIHLQALAEGLAARGHYVTVLVTNIHPYDEIIQHGTLRIIKAARLVHLSSTPLSIQMLRHARRIRNVDIVHLQFPYPPGDLVARVVPGAPPLVITYQSDIVRQQAILKLYRPLLQRTLGRAARIITTSPAYRASSPWLRPYQHKTVVVPLSVDAARFANPNPTRVAELRARYGTPLLLFVGRLRYYKGLHILLDAMTMLRHQHAHLIIVGSGPEEHRLRAQIASLGLGNRVTIVGDICDDELPNYYAAADVFVLPSHLRAEAFGIVILEAHAAARPVVCTELSTGTSYATLHGVDGFVVPPARSAELARALDVLLHNPTLAAKMGAAGQARVVREFSHTQLVNACELLYADILRL